MSGRTARRYNLGMGSLAVACLLMTLGAGAAPEYDAGARIVDGRALGDIAIRDDVIATPLRRADSRTLWRLPDPLICAGIVARIFSSSKLSNSGACQQVFAGLMEN